MDWNNIKALSYNGCMLDLSNQGFSVFKAALIVFLATRGQQNKTYYPLIKLLRLKCYHTAAHVHIQ